MRFVLAFLLSLVMLSPSIAQLPVAAASHELKAGWNDRLIGSVPCKQTKGVYMAGNWELPPVQPGGSPGISNFFVALFDTSGAVVWSISNQPYVTQNTLVTSITTDDSDNVYITGVFYYPTLNFGGKSLYGGLGVNPHSFIAKINPQSQVLWLTGFDAGNISTCPDIEVDLNGKVNVLVSHFFTFSAIGQTFTTASDKCSYTMACIDAISGSITSLTPLLTIPRTKGSFSRFALKKQGVSDRYYLCGAVDTINTTKINFYPKGKTDILILGFDTLGNVTDSASIGGERFEYFRDFISDNEDGLYVYGYFVDSVMIQQQMYYSNGSTDLFICRFNTNLVYQWNRIFGSPKVDVAYDISITTQNQLSVGLTFADTICKVGGFTFRNPIGKNNALALIFDKSGSLKWGYRANYTNATSYQGAHQLVSGYADHSFYMVGEYNGDISVSLQGVNTPFQTSNALNKDLYLIRFKRCMPDSVRLGRDTILPQAGILLDAGHPGSSYYWMPGGDQTQQLLVTSPGQYSVTVLTDCGTLSDTIEILAPMPVSYFSSPHIAIYPNPTRGDFYVDPRTEDEYLVEIFAVDGRCISKRMIRRKEHFVLTEQGVFLVKISDAQGRLHMISKIINGY